MDDKEKYQVTGLESLYLSDPKDIGSYGYYNPKFNQIKLMDEIIANKGYDPSGHNVLLHEQTHQNQFNLPGDYTSPESVRIASDIEQNGGVYGLPLRNAYHVQEMPYEVPAFIAGINDNKTDLMHSQAVAQMTPEQKLWLERNTTGYLTDQNYLENVDRFGISGAAAIERVRHIAREKERDLREKIEPPVSVKYSDVSEDLRQRILNRYLEKKKPKWEDIQITPKGM